VNRVLTKLEGVKDVDISLEQQSVKVKTAPALEYETVLETIKKTGKAVKERKVVA
jgi:copper chaperone